jgi:anti-sigma factor RsiW
MNLTRFDELLPFFVNGTLGDDDRLFVERWLREHPSAEAELRWARSLQQRLQEDVAAVSSEVGLERTMQRIRAERPKAAAPAAPVSLASPWQRARDWLATLLPQPMRGPALAGALAVVALQGVVI